MVTLVPIPSGIVLWTPAQLMPLRVKSLLGHIGGLQASADSSHIEQESMEERGAQERHTELQTVLEAKMSSTRIWALIRWGTGAWTPGEVTAEVRKRIPWWQEHPYCDLCWWK